MRNYRFIYTDFFDVSDANMMTLNRDMKKKTFREYYHTRFYSMMKPWNLTKKCFFVDVTLISKELQLRSLADWIQTMNLCLHQNDHSYDS